MIKKTAIALIVCGLLTQALFGDVWGDLAKYKYGDPSNAGQAVEKVLQDTPVAQYAGLEAKLLAVVGAKDATQDGKAIACRMLQQVGSKKAIPVLSTLLGDKILSHYARLLLQRLECEEADAAMRDALAQAPDPVKVGILNSLGARRDPKAVASVSALAKSSDPAVATAAIRALGFIGGKQAAKSLSALEPPKKLIPVRLQAMVQCATSLTGQDAAYLCEEVLAGSYSPCRTAALRMLASADPAKASGRLATAIKGDDAKLQKGALGIVASTKGAALTKAMLALMGGLKPQRKAALILALGLRGDESALAGLTAMIKSEEAVVRDAAIKAVSKLGGVGAVRVLLGMADSPAVGASVTQAIARMTGDKIDAALIDAIGDSKLRKPAIQACIARGCKAAVPGLLKLTADADAAARKDAWAGIATLGEGDDMDAIMKAVTATKDAKDLPAAEDAIRKVAARATDKPKCFGVLAGSFDKAPQSTKAVLLALGSISGGPAALSMQQKALASGSKDLQGQALRTLAAWPNEAAAPDLLKLAKGATGEVDRILALRGYIRIAGLESASLTGAQRTAMFKTAMGLAQRADEKKQIVSGLQHATSLEALAMLEKYMADPAFAAEAEMSAATVAWDLRTSCPDEATAVATRLQKSKNKTVAKKASQTLADLKKPEGYVRGWLMSEVYTGRDGGTVHKTAYGPEKGDKDAKWRTLRKGVGREMIDLRQGNKPTDRCCVYIKTTLVSPSAQAVRLEMGCDDGIKVWLNGKQIYDRWRARNHKAGQFVAKTKLVKGANQLMVKVTNENRNWAFSCRLRQNNGLPVEGVQVKPE